MPLYVLFAQQIKISTMYQPEYIAEPSRPPTKNLVNKKYTKSVYLCGEAHE